MYGGAETVRYVLAQKGMRPELKSYLRAVAYGFNTTYGYSFRDQADLAQEVGVTPKTLRKYQDKCVALGYIKVMKRRGGHAHFANNRYVIAGVAELPKRLFRHYGDYSEAEIAEAREIFAKASAKWASETVPMDHGYSVSPIKDNTTQEDSSTSRKEEVDNTTVVLYSDAVGIRLSSTSPPELADVQRNERQPQPQQECYCDELDPIEWQRAEWESRRLRASSTPSQSHRHDLEFPPLREETPHASRPVWDGQDDYRLGDFQSSACEGEEGNLHCAFPEPDRPDALEVLPFGDLQHWDYPSESPFDEPGCANPDSLSADAYAQETATSGPRDDRRGAPEVEVLLEVDGGPRLGESAVHRAIWDAMVQRIGERLRRPACSSDLEKPNGPGLPFAISGIRAHAARGSTGLGRGANSQHAAWTGLRGSHPVGAHAKTTTRSGLRPDMVRERGGPAYASILREQGACSGGRGTLQGSWRSGSLRRHEHEAPGTREDWPAVCDGRSEARCECGHHDCRGGLGCSLCSMAEANEERNYLVPGQCESVPLGGWQDGCANSGPFRQHDAPGLSNGYPPRVSGRWDAANSRSEETPQRGTRKTPSAGMPVLRLPQGERRSQMPMLWQGDNLRRGDGAWGAFRATPQSRQSSSEQATLVLSAPLDSRPARLQGRLGEAPSDGEVRRLSPRTQHDTNACFTRGSQLRESAFDSLGEEQAQSEEGGIVANVFATYAPRYASFGLQVFPLVPGTKEPFKRSHGLKDATSDPKQVALWAKLYPNANIGIRTGACSGVDVIDIDPKNGGIDTAWALWHKGMLLPGRMVAKTRSDGYHLYVKHNPLIRTGTNRLGPGIDFRGEGGYVVAPGSIVGGKVYHMIRRAPFPDAPSWLLDRLAAERVRELTPRQPVLLSNLGDDKERVLNALEYISCDDRDTWVRVGMALCSGFGAQGRPLWDAWSVQSSKYNERSQDKIWRSFKNPRVGLGTIFEMRRGQRFKHYEL